MNNIFNTILYILKFILFFLALGLSFYIILGMYNRLDRSYYYSLSLIVPYMLVIIVFCLNLFKNQKTVINNIFYNLTCVLVFITIIIVCLRTIFDKNMILNNIMGLNINFSYFNDFLNFMKIMLYGVFFSNIFLILSSLKLDSKEKSIDVIEVL